MRHRLAALFVAAGTLIAAPAARADTASEAAASAAMAQVAGNAARLRVFLQAMPKGGDLHNHLGGTPYAEDYLKLAAENGMCVDEGGLAFVPPPCAADRTVKSLAEQQPFAFGRLVDSLSTRGVQRGVGADEVSGHDQFFASFDKFGPAYQSGVPRWMSVALRNAARDHADYLELMHDPAVLVDYATGGRAAPLIVSQLADFYMREQPTLGALVRRARAEVDEQETQAKRLLACGTKAADPACTITVRYLAFAWRGVEPARAFRSLIGAFALADADPRFVGVNIVMPEDDPVALRDYALHMAMFRFLAARYPKVRISMHAGELALGLVPPEDLRNHIAQAVAAGAHRIGHGTAIAYEDDAEATLSRMARDGIVVEANLTSNAVILGVRGGEHPLQLYRISGVPVVLSTDDEGVLRSDLTNEYQRAVTEQGLGYSDLKELARASLEYAFVPGDSLWRERRLGERVRACTTGLTDRACASFLERSEKARLQAALEARFDSFERAVTAPRSATGHDE